MEEVVAHLTAASLGGFRWIRSMIGARFDADLHNAGRLSEHRGATPAETLDRFRAAITSTRAPSGRTPAWLGEVVVHAQDIRRPLGLERTPSVDALTSVATFFASRDFTVAGKTAIAGLRVEATDGPFAHGDGPLVRGTTVALAMAMAGRTAHYDNLDGPGVAILRTRQGSSRRNCHHPGMDIAGVDPRDETWALDEPRYRVHFFDGTASDEYEITGAPDIHAVLRWADADEAGRPYAVHARVDRDGIGLVRLAGSDPNDSRRAR